MANPPNPNGSGNLPAKTSVGIRNLQRGNPGNKGGTGRPSNALRIRARSISPKALDVAQNILEGKETEPRVVGKSVEYLPPANQTKLAAAELILRVADDLPRQGLTLEAQGDVNIRVVYDDE